MWILYSAQTGVRYPLLANKENVIGRKDCDILIEGDQSMSRKHAVAIVVHPENHLPFPHKPPVLTIKDTSKFGTFVNGSRIQGERELKDGDEIKFGAQSSFRVKREPFIVTTSCLDNSVKKSVKGVIRQLGGHVLGDWRRECDMLVMSTISVTIKVVCALISQKPIVTPEYLTQLLEAYDQNKQLPNPDDFIPALAELLLNPDEVSFKKNPARQTLFSGMKFIFLSPKQFRKLSIAVELAGGTPVLMEEGTDDNNDKVLIERGTCVMYCEPPTNPQLLSKNARDWVTHVQRYLKRHKQRQIQDAELGFAVLYCSTDSYCNPEREPASSLLQIPSQSQVAASFTQQSQSVRNVKTEATAPCIKQEPQSQLTQDVSQYAKDVSHQPQLCVPETQQTDASFTVPSTSTHTSLSRKRLRSKETEESHPASKAIKTEPDTPVVCQNTESIKIERITPTRAECKSRVNVVAETQLESETEMSRIDMDTVKIEDDEEEDNIEQEFDDIVPSLKQKNSKRDRDFDGPRASKTSTDEMVTSSPMVTNVVPKASPSSRSDQDYGKVQPSTSKTNRTNAQGQKTIGRLTYDDQEDSLTEVEVNGNGSTSGHKDPPPGFLTKNTEATSTLIVHNGENRVNGQSEGEESLPRNLIQVQFASMVVRKTRPQQSKQSASGVTTWNGKKVKNFKNFRKVNQPLTNGIPHIIGGRDLEKHVNGPRKELDDWFREELEAESQQEAAEKLAMEMFDEGMFNRKTKRR
ncbi:nibrin [Lingula anatina]|uniref:Nibrin n=1 Tax=Lingula anatina TaxID=7574 RepID=A0A1S3K6I0_LINAN|nr:nibrin [Lingula anatina]|eukprot:XP_013418240.1 nibrin [Lingula anatina]